MRLIVAALLLAGCSSASVASSPDLSEIPRRSETSPDLAQAVDLGSAPDLDPPAQPDLSGPPDLASGDAAEAVDSALPPACGGAGQTCCANFACSTGTCMGSAMGYPAGSGIIKTVCVVASSCGAYAYPACAYTDNGVPDSWCKRNVSNTDWYRGNPCK